MNNILEKIYTVAEAAKIMRRTVKCLQLWDAKNILKAHRTQTNRRYYFQSQLDEFLNKKYNTPIENKISIAYCRVSSYSQKLDLKNQRRILEEFCITKGWSNVKFVEEIGGGLNFKRKEFYNIINDIISDKVDKIILAHKDRFCRFGFELIEKLCEDHSCELHIIDSQSLSPQEEVVKDLMTIIHCFSSRLYGLRNYKKSLQLALK